MVSESHLNYFFRQPKIPKSVYNKFREGLIIGTACEAGELYKSVLEDKLGKRLTDYVNSMITLRSSQS